MASLAGISRYELLDINTEVFRNFNKQFKRIIEPLEEGGSSANVSGAAGLIAALRSSQTSATADGGVFTPVDVGRLRRYIVPSGLGESQEEVLPEFPLKINGPNIYYLYVGPNQ